MLHLEPTTCPFHLEPTLLFKRFPLEGESGDGGGRGKEGERRGERGGEKSLDWLVG